MCVKNNLIHIKRNHKKKKKSIINIMIKGKYLINLGKLLKYETRQIIKKI